MSKLNFLISSTAFLFFYFSSSPAAAADTLTAGQSLADGDTLLSAGNSFALGFFSPANCTNRYVGIWYGNSTAFTVVWVANRESPITARSTGALNLTSTGSLLLISNQSSTPLWSTAVAPAASSFVAQLLDSGNFVVRWMDSNNNSGEIIWQSFDHPTDTLLPGMKLGVDLKSGLSRNLTSWTSPSDPSPGKYTLSIDIEGVPQLVIKSESARVWRGGPWNGDGFVGAGSKLNNDPVAYISNYQANQDEIYYSYDVHSFVTRVVIGKDGKDKLLILSDPSDNWGVLWSDPNDACDHPSTCMPYSVCDISKPPSSLCSCLPGFEYQLGLCQRTKSLQCGGLDGFSVVKRVKLPDTSAATLVGELDLKSCRERCLRNCSCTAYASANVTTGGRGCIMWTSQLTDIRVFTSGGQDLYVRLVVGKSSAQV